MGVLQNQNNSTFEDLAHPTITLQTYGVIRKYMNGAVCVESPANASDLCRLASKCSLQQVDSACSLKRVKCSCSSSSNLCGFHKHTEKDHRPKRIVSCESTKKRNSKSAKEDNRGNFISRSQNLDELKLCLGSLTEGESSSGETTEKQNLDFQNWIWRKNEEKKLIQQRGIEIKGKQEKLKQLQLNQERENFKRWLYHKQKETEMRKRSTENELAEQKAKEALKERRLMESKLKYQLWLKEKEEQDLIKKIENQLKEMEIYTKKQERLQENERAFQSWLKTSKDKPKPLPLGKGLDSLTAAASVEYINPIPWATYKDQGQKSSSR